MVARQCGPNWYSEGVTTGRILPSAAPPYSPPPPPPPPPPRLTVATSERASSAVSMCPDGGVWSLRGFISLIILGIGILGYAFPSTDNELNEKYDTELAQFSENENETLVFYDNLNTGTSYSLLKELDEKTIPKWKENVRIINKTNQFENLPSELIEQNEILLKYSEMRVQAFELFRKAIKEDTEKYSQQLEQLHKQIDKELEKLN